MSLDSVQNLHLYFGIATPLLQGLIVAGMIRKRLVRQFPAFFAYTAFVLASSLGLLALYRLAPNHYPLYFKAFWICSFGWLVLRFAVIREIYQHLFQNHPSLQHLGAALLRWGSVLFLLLGVVVAGYAPGDFGNRLFAGLHVLDRTVSLIQVGLLVLLFLFSSYLRLSWREYTVGIALGLGIYASVDLGVAALLAQIGPQVRPTLGHYVLEFISAGTFQMCVFVWVMYLLIPQRATAGAGFEKAPDLDGWNAELERLLKS